MTSEQRHRNMAAIHSKDTKPEMVVRRGLWKRGFRYRLNYKRLPGHPDLVLRKYRTCIFVNGCFWHGHHVNLQLADLQSPISYSERCKSQSENRTIGQSENAQIAISDSGCCKIPKTNREFWVNKIRRNKERDLRVQRELASMGWHSITVWECELKPARREQTLAALAFTLNKIFLQDRTVSVGQFEGQAVGQLADLQFPIPDSDGLRRYEIPDEPPMMAAEDLPAHPSLGMPEK